MKLCLLLPALAAAASLTACEPGNLVQDPVLHVASGQIKLGATADRPAVGYFTVEGGDKAVELVAVTADLARRVEMHESAMEDGMMTMKAIRSAAVPAKGKLVFAQGGKHLMIWHINPAAIKAGYLPMVFIFTNNDHIIFDVPIEKPVAAAGTDTKSAAPAQTPAPAHTEMKH